MISTEKYKPEQQTLRDERKFDVGAFAFKITAICKIRVFGVAEHANLSVLQVHHSWEAAEQEDVGEKNGPHEARSVLHTG